MRDGPSRPKADTGRGLPPNISCEWWPMASDPQSTTVPVASGGVFAAVCPEQGASGHDASDESRNEPVANLSPTW